MQKCIWIFFYKKNTDTNICILNFYSTILNVTSSNVIVPFTSSYFQSKGDPITDLTEDMAAEQKARTTYENLMMMTDDEDVLSVLRFLRQREIVHYQRFAEALELVKCRLNEENFYAYNPALK